MILECKSIREQELLRLQNDFLKISKQLKLAIIKIGSFKENEIYLKQKKKIANLLNVEIVEFFYDSDSTQDEIIKNINNLNNDPSITGIMIQKPILDKFDYYKLVNIIDYKKDIDGVTNKNKLIIPATAKAVLKVLEEYKISIKNKNIVIIGKSDLVGMPLYNILKNNNSVILCDSKTENIKDKIKNADVIISAIGKSKYFTKDYFRDGQVIIDVGTNFLDGKLVGDIDFEKVKNFTDITPVPDGVGQLTTIYLFDNLLELNNKY